MGLDLTDEEIKDISYLKKGISQYLKDNLQDFNFEDFGNYARSILEDVPDNMGFERLGYDPKEQVIDVAITILGEDKKVEKRTEFVIHSFIDKSELEKMMDSQIEACEPWRKTNPKLADQDAALKEACNSTDKYVPSILFDTDRLVNVFTLCMIPFGIVSIVKIVSYSLE
jgi:hypothetical protein